MATLEITEQNLESTLTDNDIVVLDYWASWCGPCVRFAPVFESASESHTDIVFGKVNTEEQQGLAMGAGIQSIPTIQVFRDQILLYSQAGALPPAAFEDLLQKVKDLDMDEVRAELAKQRSENADA